MMGGFIFPELFPVDDVRREGRNDLRRNNQPRRVDDDFELRNQKLATGHAIPNPYIAVAGRFGNSGINVVCRHTDEIFELTGHGLLPPHASLPSNTRRTCVCNIQCAKPVTNISHDLTETSGTDSPILNGSVNARPFIKSVGLS